MNTPQFLTKLSFFFAILAFHTTDLSAQSEQASKFRAYRLYNWVWGDGLGSASPIRTCTNAPAFEACQNRIVMPFNQEMRGQTVNRGGELKDFVRQYDRLDSISSDEVCILGFAFCDSTYLTYRVFVYDLKERALKHEFEYCVLPQSDVNLLLERLAIKLGRACKNETAPLDEKEDIDKIAIPSLARLEEALFVHRYEQMYYQTANKVGTTGNIYPAKSSSAWLLNGKAKQRAQEIIKAIEHYKTVGRGNYKYLEEQYAARNKRDPILMKFEADYPRIWALLELIVAMEAYKDKPRGSDGDSLDNKSHLKTTRQRLSRIDTLIQKVKLKYQVREEELMTKGKFQFDELRQEMLMASQLLLNCDEIFTTAENYYNQGDYVKATQIYMNILSNREIEELGKLKDDDMKCGKLKDLSYSKLDILSRRKVVAYKSSLAEADKAFWKLGSHRNHIGTIDALYNQADSLDIGLSMYPKLRRVAYLKQLADSIQQNNPNNSVEILKLYEAIVAIHPDKVYKKQSEKIDEKIAAGTDRDIAIYDRDTWYRKLIAIGSIVSKHFNAASPTMSMVGQKMTQNVATDGSNMITLSLMADPKNLKGWVSEINFGLGYFESPNEKFVDERLAAALREIENVYARDLSKIYIKFIGSADATSFRGSALSVGNYKNLQADVALCEQPQQTYSFQLLRKGKWAETYGDMQTKDVITKDKDIATKGKRRKPKINPDEDKAKNTALAYLRAKNRFDHLMELLNNSCAKYIEPSLCAQVAQEEGLEYRFVNIEISFLLKK